MDPLEIEENAMHVVLHAWVTLYLSKPAARASFEPFAQQLETQATRLRESAVALQAALEKMRIANERLAARMAEHKAFFAKYQAPE